MEEQGRVMIHITDKGIIKIHRGDLLHTAGYRDRKIYRRAICPASINK